MGSKNRDKKKVRKLSRSKNRLYLGGVAVALLAGLLMWNRIKTSELSRYSMAEGTALSAYVRREAKPTLAPALFVGKTERAYRIAHDMPDVIDQLYCYCECDKHSGHLSLLSCYTDNHAANCDICQDEALDAAQMQKQGYSVGKIRAYIDQKYSRM